MAGRRLGVRFSDGALAELTDRVLPADDDPVEGDPWFCALAGRDEGAVREKHALFMGGTVVMRGSSPGHLVRALARNLAAVGQVVSEPDLLHLRLVGFVKERGVVLLDPALATHYEPALPPAARSGWSGTDLAITSVDVDAGEVVLPDVATAGAEAGALEGLGPAGRGEAPLAGGRARLLGLASHDASAAGLVNRVLARAGFPWEPRRRREVDRVAEMAGRVPAVATEPSPDGVAGTLSRLGQS